MQEDEVKRARVGKAEVLPVDTARASKAAAKGRTVAVKAAQVLPCSVFELYVGYTSAYRSLLS